MWQPVRIDQLLVGHYVRLDYPWYAHPFLHNKFYIASQRDIDIIREQNLVRIYQDPDKARFHDVADPVDEVKPNSAPSVAAHADSAPGATATPAAAEATDEFAEKRRLQAWSREQTRRAQLKSDAVAKDASAIVRALDELAAGNEAGMDSVDTIVARTLEQAGSDKARPVFVGQVFAEVRAPQTGIACCGAVAMAALLARQRGLDVATQREVVLGAALHGIGAQRFTAAQRAEDGWQRSRVRDPYHAYPDMGAEVLRKCGRVPPEVIRLVRQHRELLDGSGFPEGLQGEAIRPGALIIGLVREYLTLTADVRPPTPLPPPAVLAHMYKNRRALYGEALVDAFIAMLTVYPPGTFVEMTGGEVGMVLSCNAAQRLSPTVLIIDGPDHFEDFEVMDLSTTDQVKVERIFRRDQVPPVGREFARASLRSGVAIDIVPD